MKFIDGSVEQDSCRTKSLPWTDGMGLARLAAGSECALRQGVLDLGVKLAKGGVVLEQVGRLLHASCTS